MRIEHGTRAGYRAELAAKIPTCEACRAANAAQAASVRNKALTDQSPRIYTYAHLTREIGRDHAEILVIETYLRLRSARATARDLGIGTRTVERILGRHHVNTSTTIDKSVRRRALAMMETGMSSSQVSSALGIKQTTLLTWRQRYLNKR